MVTINVSHHCKAILWSEVGFHMECKYRLRYGTPQLPYDNDN